MNKETITAFLKTSREYKTSVTARYPSNMKGKSLSFRSEGNLALTSVSISPLDLLAEALALSEEKAKKKKGAKPFDIMDFNPGVGVPLDTCSESFLNDRKKSKKGLNKR